MEKMSSVEEILCTECGFIYDFNLDGILPDDFCSCCGISMLDILIVDK